MLFVRSYRFSRPPEIIGTYYNQPQENSQHMFCVPESDVELLNILNSPPFSFVSMASASVIASSMESDWKFVLTSEI